MGEHLFRVWSVSFLGAVLSLSCDEGLSCTAVGCGPTHQMRLELGDEAESFEPVTVRVCFNDDCDEGVLDEPSISEGWQLGSPRIFADASVSCQSTPCVLVATWSVDASDVREGDRYEVVATSSAGDVRAQGVELANGYARSFPNGRECDGDGCVTVSGVTPE